MGQIVTLLKTPEKRLPNTIDEVITSLDEIIEWALHHRSPLGYFPALYRKVTLAVRDAIDREEFDDNCRMERLDVIFANRYIEAFNAHRKGHRVTKSWQAAFQAAEAKDLLVIQHLLLGMNAHINLDLGVAAAAVASGTQIHDLKNDFMQINEILASLVDEVESRISQISPCFGLLDWLGGRTDERTVDFGMQAARDAAWMEARRFAAVPVHLRTTHIEILDEYVAGLTKLVRGKGGWIQKVCRVVRLVESRDIQRNILVLK